MKLPLFIGGLVIGGLITYGFWTTFAWPTLYLAIMYVLFSLATMSVGSFVLSVKGTMDAMKSPPPFTNKVEEIREKLWGGKGEAPEYKKIKDIPEAILRGRAPEEAVIEKELSPEAPKAAANLAKPAPKKPPAPKAKKSAAKPKK